MDVIPIETKRRYVKTESYDSKIIFKGFRPINSLQIHENYKSDVRFPETYKLGGGL